MTCAYGDLEGDGIERAGWWAAGSLGSDGGCLPVAVTGRVPRLRVEHLEQLVGLPLVILPPPPGGACQPH
jgi:hypothetical protein